MADADSFLGADPETIRSITRQTMVDAACELIARIPFAHESERVGALAQIADSVLPAAWTIDISREV